ncbi:MAG: hypothetical protein ISS18_15190 [Bacteroidales bacterium]|nr:hypothetical protein [Bacteroidales bacterium]
MAIKPEYIRTGSTPGHEGILIRVPPEHEEKIEQEATKHDYKYFADFDKKPCFLKKWLPFIVGAVLLVIIVIVVKKLITRSASPS